MHTSKMPKNAKHCAISKLRTGFNFKELHKWIDEDGDSLGINHRCKRHFYNTKLEKQIKKYWNSKSKKLKRKNLGEKAVVEWLFHIALDNLETAMKRGKKVYKKVHNYFKFGWCDDGFILFDSKKINEDGLKKEFEDSYDFED